MVNFPNNPTDGTTHSEAGQTWIYNDPPGAWQVLSSGAVGNFTSGPTLPASPVLNDKHFLTVAPVGEYIWYDDGDSQQWVQTQGGTAQVYEDGLPRFEEFHDPSGVASWRIIGVSLECWGVASSATAGYLTINFPKTFASPPIVNSNALGSNGVVNVPVVANYQITETTAQVRRARSNDATDFAVDVFWRAIGKWDGVS